MIMISIHTTKPIDWANNRKKSLKDIKTTFASFNISLGLKLNYPSHATVSATPAGNFGG